MEGKSDWGGIIIIIIVVLALIYGSTENTQSPTNHPITVYQPAEWEQYANIPIDADLKAQLSNTHYLILALQDDITRQNVDFDMALSTIINQLIEIQNQAAEEREKQIKENWKFAFIGAFIGWVFSFITSPDTVATRIKKIFLKPENSDGDDEQKSDINQVHDMKYKILGGIIIILFVLSLVSLIVVSIDYFF